MPEAFKSIPETVIIEESHQLYPNEWILMKVTAFDFHQVPTHGIVFEHTLNRRRITDVSLEERGKYPDLPQLIYHTTAR